MAAKKDESKTKKVIKPRKKAAKKIVKKDEPEDSTVVSTSSGRKYSPLARGMNFLVSAYVYFVAFTLVIYMVSTLIGGVLGMVTGFLDIASSPSGLLGAFANNEVGALNVELLHTIAFTIVLVKAYKILIEFAQTKHINIKFLVEIAIIAPTIELLFNSGAYSLYMNILFAVFAIANLIVYLLNYKKLKQVSDDYIKEWQTC